MNVSGRGQEVHWGPPVKRRSYLYLHGERRKSHTWEKFKSSIFSVLSKSLILLVDT